MSSRVMEGRREPITFANAPTVEHEGRHYLTDEAAEVLADQLAEKYSSLLAKLAEE